MVTGPMPCIAHLSPILVFPPRNTIVSRQDYVIECLLIPFLYVDSIIWHAIVETGFKSVQSFDQVLLPIESLFSSYICLNNYLMVFFPASAGTRDCLAPLVTRFISALLIDLVADPPMLAGLFHLLRQIRCKGVEIWIWAHRWWFVCEVVSKTNKNHVLLFDLNVFLCIILSAP